MSFFAPLRLCVNCSVLSAFIPEIRGSLFSAQPLRTLRLCGECLSLRLCVNCLVLSPFIRENPRPAFLITSPALTLKSDRHHSPDCHVHRDSRLRNRSIRPALPRCRGCDRTSLPGDFPDSRRDAHPASPESFACRASIRKRSCP